MSKELFENEMQKENSQVKKLGLNEIALYFNDLLGSVENGSSDAIVTLSRLSAIEKEIKACKDAVYQSALIEAENYTEKTFNYKGLIVEKRQGRKVYNFKQIAEWVSAKNELSNKEKMYKAAYDSWQRGAKMFDEETGEEIPIPAVTNTRDVLVIKEVKRVD